ncbi:MAG: hypothetical protein WBM08_14940 [Prochlorococcaceae cyanobacterium]
MTTEHTNTRRRSSAAQSPLEAQPSKPCPPVLPPEPQPKALPAAAASPLAAAPSLPPLDAPATNANQPTISYKPAFSFAQSKGWDISRDGGKSKAPAGTDTIAGVIYDLTLEIAAAKWEAGRYDYRLSMAFVNQEGVLAEVNTNAIAYRDGVGSMTNPTRCLLAALLEISESDDDIEALGRGMRLTIRPGTRTSTRAQFIDLGIVYGDRNGQPSWTNAGGAKAFQAMDPSIMGLIHAVTLIKRRLYGAGLLQPGNPIRGEVPDEAIGDPSNACIEVVPIAVDQQLG